MRFVHKTHLIVQISKKSPWKSICYPFPPEKNIADFLCKRLPARMRPCASFMSPPENLGKNVKKTVKAQKQIYAFHANGHYQLEQFSIRSNSSSRRKKEEDAHLFMFIHHRLPSPFPVYTFFICTTTTTSLWQFSKYLHKILHMPYLCFFWTNMLLHFQISEWLEYTFDITSFSTQQQPSI